MKGRRWHLHYLNYIAVGQGDCQGRTGLLGSAVQDCGPWAYLGLLAACQVLAPPGYHLGPGSHSSLFLEARCCWQL